MQDKIIAWITKVNITFSPHSNSMTQVMITPCETFRKSNRKLSDNCNELGTEADDVVICVVSNSMLACNNIMIPETNGLFSRNYFCRIT